MHAFSILTLGIFVAGYSTARWDLTTRGYELVIFAWEHGVVVRVAKGLLVLSLLFAAFIFPIVRLALHETDQVRILVMEAQARVNVNFCSIHESRTAVSPHESN
jgi:hypothetical protein